MMDISGLDLIAAAAAGTIVHLRHPGTGAGLGIEIGVIGYESDAVKDAERAYLRRAQDAVKKPEADDFLRGRRIALAAASITSVSGMEIGAGEKETVVTVDMLRAMIAEPKWVWILEQIEATAGDRRYFFTSAETP